MVQVWTTIIPLALTFSVGLSTKSLKLLVVTIATEENDGFSRFMHSAKVFNHEVLVVGMGEEWVGGDLKNSAGGGQKVNMLRRDLKKYKDEEDLVIMFSDSYDVVLAADSTAILEKFQQMNSRLVFSAENSLWPDKTLDAKYPKVPGGKHYLCSGGIIGYAKEFWLAITHHDITHQDDDQLYYTHVFLNETSRRELNATLDYTSKIFHNFNFAKDEIELKVLGVRTTIKNSKYNTFPSVLHGNGPSKIYLNYVANYVPDGWQPELGCQNCHNNEIEYNYEDDDGIPHVMIAVFLIEDTPFLTEFFNRIANLSYPKSRISLFVHVQTSAQERVLAKFLLKYRSFYKAVRILPYYDHIDDWNARNSAVDHCLLVKCDYFFSIDSIVQLTNPMALKYLLRKNRQFIAPLVKRDGKLWSNFWGALNADGFYARSEDYLDIVNNVKIGVWNVPFVSSIYLIKGSTLKDLATKVAQPYVYDTFDADMAFCSNLRDKNIFMYVSNEETFGRLVEIDEEESNAAKLHPDLWEVERNKADWEEKYIHPDFWKAVDPDTEVSQPCPDVFSFPLMTEAYANQLIETVEEKNLWSAGKNKDPRIAGGYENVPTIDIHMNQIGYEKEWLHVLKHYITQLVEKVFPGYYSKAKSSMMFIVRYKPDEQPYLRPHHDSSTWTMNVALNSQGEDYEGGGCRFLRYNCSATSLPQGWALLHPGRLTHYHEGLYTTKGTRYIFVSFVDP